MPGINVFLVYGFACLAILTSGDDQPDRFAYHAKLLDKMVRMEMKMEGMEKELEETQTNVNIFIKNQTNILENKTAELKLLEERVELPLVAFNAYSPIDTSPDTNEIIIWQSTHLNEGKGYDTVIGIFKAPVSGLYYFAVHVCNYSSRVFQYAIVLENNQFATSYKYDNNNNDCGSMSSFIKVTAGQRVWVQCTSGNTNAIIWESSGRSSFIGFLVHK